MVPPSTVVRGAGVDGRSGGAMDRLQGTSVQTGEVGDDENAAQSDDELEGVEVDELDDSEPDDELEEDESVDDELEDDELEDDESAEDELVEDESVEDDPWSFL